MFRSRTAWKVTVDGETSRSCRFSHCTINRSPDTEYTTLSAAFVANQLSHSGAIAAWVIAVAMPKSSLLGWSLPETPNVNSPFELTNTCARGRFVP